MNEYSILTEVSGEQMMLINYATEPVFGDQSSCSVVYELCLGLLGPT